VSAAPVASFAAIEDAFLATVRRTVYCTMVTVDRRGRPRARVVLPVWEVAGGRPVGWLATYRTPVKAAHLAHNPHTTYAYWHPEQDAAFVDSVSSWADDAPTAHRVWELYRAGSPPGVGYDPRSFWSRGPADPEYRVLRIDPWRIQVVRGADLTSRVWSDGG
jgi:hypothetical protein